MTFHEDTSDLRTINKTWSKVTVKSLGICHYMSHIGQKCGYDCIWTKHTMAHLSVRLCFYRVISLYLALSYNKSCEHDDKTLL